MRDQVFISYSHRDAPWLQRLQVYLAPLERRGRVRRWDDGMIAPGQRWEAEIAAALARTRVAVLLVSAEFLASDFISRVELPRLLGAADDEGVRIIPLVLDHCNFERMPELAQFQAIHTPTQPLETLPEPEQKAVLARLAAAVEDALGDLVDGPVPAAPARLVGLPARNPLFCGRDDTLQALQTALTRGARVALCGLPGLGKSETLIEFAHRRRGAYAWIFWCRADTDQQLLQGFGAIAAALALPEAKGADQQAAARAALAALDTREHWLLILDGADELERVRPWLPGAPHAAVLLSTRGAALGGLAEVVSLDGLDDAAALEFLLRRAGLVEVGTALAPELAAGARAVVRICAGLPLALDQAGAYVDETACSLDEYAALWRAHSSQLLDQRGSGSLRQDESLWQAWTVSLQQLQQVNAAAADLLRLFSFCHADALPDTSLGHVAEAPWADALARNAALREAMRFAFLRRDAKTRRLHVHPMVQQFLRDGLDAQARRALCERALDWMDRAFPAPRFANWRECDALTAHGLAVLEHAALAGIRSPARARLAAELGYYLIQRVRYAQARPLVEAALALRRAPPVDGPALARALVIDGQMQIATGRYDAAAASFEEAAALLAGQPPSADLVQVFDRLAAVELARDQLETARTWLARARDAIAAAAAHDSVEAAQCANDLGALLLRQGDLAGARLAFEQAAALRRTLLPPDHPSVSQSLNNLAVAYKLLGELPAARAAYQEALALRESALGGEHPYVAESLLNIGLLQLREGDAASARTTIERALAIQRACRGPLHPDVAASEVCLAEVALTEGRFDEAATLAGRARDARRQLLGAAHADTALAQALWGRIARARGDRAGAAAALVEALPLLQARLGPTHKETLACVAELAALEQTAPGGGLPA